MTLRKLTFTTFWLLLTVVPILAQATCPDLVDTALNAIGDNCAEMDRNTACYGFDRVDTLFAVQQPADFFSQPADRTELLNLSTIRTYPLDTTTGRFGVAVLNVQANIPESLPGQGILFMLVGDAEMTNAVAPDQAAQPVPAVPVTTAVETALFTLPSTTANTRRDNVAAGTELEADGFNGAHDWLRIVSNNDIAWVPLSAITPAAAIDSLPILGASSQTPMQAFYFSTGVGQPACHEAAASIAVQSPENLTVDLTVNGVDIQVGSLVTFTDNTLTVHRGHVTTSLGQEVNANETLELSKDDEGNFVGDGSVRPIDDDEFERGQQVQDGLNNVAENNGWETQEITPLEEQPGTEVLEDGTIIHIVQAGESLYGIATLYSASMPAIADANGLTDPFTVFVGQRLRIPNPGSGFVLLPVRPRPPEDTTDTGLPPTEEASPFVDCSTFALISGGESMLSTFAWTSVPGADEYKLNFSGSEGNYVTSFFIPAPTTSIDINMGDIGTGAYFQWEVEALREHQSYCTMRTSSTAPKPLDPNPPQAPGFSASRICIGINQANVTWSNAKGGSTVTVFGAEEFVSGPPVDFTASFPNTPNGSALVTVTFDLGTIQVSSDGGDFISLPGCPDP